MLLPYNQGAAKARDAVDVTGREPLGHDEADGGRPAG